MNICLIIGYPVKGSCSPLIHNAGYKNLGIDDQFNYLATDVKPEHLKMAIAGIKALGIKGVSVTMPHKQKVMEYLDTIDKEAEKIKAVNTILNSNGKLIGYNTDYIGAITALEKKTTLKGKKTAVLGAGGAARAIIYGLKKKDAVVKIFNRTRESAKILAREFGCEYAGFESLEQVAEMDIIINATPIGMNEDKSPINKKFLNKKQIVFDIVYQPKETKLIKDAKSKGAKIIYGYEMLLYQGVVQFELYTGMKAPVNVMRRRLEQIL